MSTKTPGMNPNGNEAAYARSAHRQQQIDEKRRDEGDICDADGGERIIGEPVGNGDGAGHDRSMADNRGEAVKAIAAILANQARGCAAS